jgi:hypothetical protein
LEYTFTILGIGTVKLDSGSQQNQRYRWASSFPPTIGMAILIACDEKSILLEDGPMQ